MLDGEIVALNDDVVRHWPLFCQRLLHGDESVALVVMIFDVLRHDGCHLITRPYSERRELLDSLTLEGSAAHPTGDGPIAAQTIVRAVAAACRCLPDVKPGRSRACWPGTG